MANAAYSAAQTAATNYATAKATDVAAGKSDTNPDVTPGKGTSNLTAGNPARKGLDVARNLVAENYAGDAFVDGYVVRSVRAVDAAIATNGAGPVTTKA